ncbi:MAG: hypothetical protein QOG88_929 [Actinomycetota bacterium]|nr:hypothetical protein [Actinomycetota bacterium]
MSGTLTEAPTEPDDIPDLGPASHKLRRDLVAAGVVLLLLASTFGTFAYLGMLPGRGPLDPREELGISAGVNTHVGRAAAYTSLWIYNPSRVDATLDSVTPTADLPEVQVLEAWFPRPSQRCEAAAAIRPLSAPADCRLSVNGYVLPAGTPTGNGPRLIVVLQSNTPGKYRSSGFDIRYHVGPFSYTTTYHDGFVMVAAPG